MCVCVHISIYTYSYIHINILMHMAMQIYYMTCLPLVFAFCGMVSMIVGMPFIVKTIYDSTSGVYDTALVVCGLYVHVPVCECVRA